MGVPEGGEDVSLNCDNPAARNLPGVFVCLFVFKFYFILSIGFSSQGFFV